MVTVFVTPPTFVAMPTIVIGTLVPFASVPIVQVTVLVPLQLGEDEPGTKVTPLGSASVIFTPVASTGPLLVATML
jgi:hypothetical protein